MSDRLLKLTAAAFPLWFASCAVSPRLALPEPDIREASLRQTVNRLCAITPARHAGNPKSMRVAADLIARSFRGNGLRAVYQNFTVDGSAYANVVASAGPEGGQRIIVGAHYDVCGDQPGADDNASAVAGLLECARWIKLHERHLHHGVDFVAYALEEPPHFGTTNMGSHFHARSLHEKGIPVRAMICMDMIGYFTDAPGSQRYPVPGLGLFYPSRGNFIAVVGNFGSAELSQDVLSGLRSTKVPVRRILAPSAVPGIDFSDHRNYWHFGYPAVMITDTAFYRSPHYHQPSDLPETLSFGPMTEVVRGVCRAVMALD